MSKGSKGVEGKRGDESSNRKVPGATQSKMQRKGKAKTEGAARKRRTPFVL